VHGAVLRLPDGTIEAFDERHPVPLVWRQRLHKAVKDWAGVYTEDKPYNVVVHYRAAPERKSDVAALVDAIVSEGQEDFEILPARMAYEIRHRALNKGSVVKRLMMLPPFRSRRPVFIGDDVTDDDGFRAAEEMGGFGLNVEEAFGGDTAHVRRWLESFSENVHQAARP
jgi:trehalose 6-phosphate phosphatase